MAFKSMKEVREFLDETERRIQEVPDGNFFKLADKLELDVLRDFAKSDLSNTDLSNGNLENADLSHANLTNADLSGANLKNANLSHATLLKTDLQGADLRGATLLNADLWETNFSEAKYDSATKFPEGFDPPKQRIHSRPLLSTSLNQDSQTSALTTASGATSDNRIFVYEVEVRNSSNVLVQVPYSRMSQEMRRITRLGGKIVNISALEAQAPVTTSALRAKETSDAEASPQIDQ